MPKVELEQVEQINRTGYPALYSEPMSKRHYRRLAAVAGLADFGVSQVTLGRGGVSSQRHWHEEEDEFLVVLDGEAILSRSTGNVTPAWRLRSHSKGRRHGHHLVNRSDRRCSFVVVGKSAQSDCHDPDIDLHLNAASGAFTHKDGSAYD